MGFVLMGIASFSGLGAMLYNAIQMVSTGRGLETYRTYWLVEFNWVSFLVLCGAVVLALIIALVLRLHDHVRWRSLEKKYGSHKS
ncbi:MAG: hypothetical protein WCF44_09595 [Candidatus Methylophosphatis roskildensis]